MNGLVSITVLSQCLLLVRDWHVGKRYGDFMLTRAMGKQIHLEKSKRKGKGKKQKGK